MSLAKKTITDPQEILKLVVGAKEVSVEIPTNETLDGAVEKLRVLSGAFTTLNRAQDALTGIIGKILREIQSRKLYRTRYKTFGEFLDSEVYNGNIKLSKSAVYNSLKIAKAFPSLSDAEYQRIGATRLLEASKRVTELKNPDQWRMVVDKFAEAGTVSQALEWANTSNIGPTRRSFGQSWAVRLSSESHALVDEYFRNEKVQKLVGDTNRENIMLWTLQYVLEHAVNASEPPLFKKATRHRAA